MILADWLNDWYALYVVPSGVRASTLDMYRRAMAAVPDEIGALELSTMGAAEVLRVRRWLVEVHQRTPRAAQLDRTMIVRALRVAGSLGLCTRGLLDADTCPQLQHTAAETAALTPEELGAYIRTAPAAAPAVCVGLLLCCCGLRRGEALGAMWADYSEVTGVLHVHQQRQWRPGRVEVWPLKTRHAERRLLLPDFVREVIAQHPNLSPWLCDTTPRRLYTGHRATLSAAGLPAITLHGLRHSFAAAAAAQGEPMKLLQVALGHGEISVTADIYADHLHGVSSLPSLVVSRAL